MTPRQVFLATLGVLSALALFRYGAWRAAMLPPLAFETLLPYLAFACEAALACAALVLAGQRLLTRATPASDADPVIAPETDVILIDTGEPVAQAQLTLAAARRLASGTRRLRIVLAASGGDRQRLSQLRALAEADGAELAVAATRDPETLFRTGLAACDAPLVLTLTTAHVPLIDALTRNWPLFKTMERLAGVILQRFTADLGAAARAPEPSLRSPKPLGEAMRVLAGLTPAPNGAALPAPALWRRSALIDAGVLRRWETPVSLLVQRGGLTTLDGHAPSVAEALPGDTAQWFARRIAALQAPHAGTALIVRRQALTALSFALAQLGAIFAAALVAGVALWPDDRASTYGATLPAYAALFVLLGLAAESTRRRWHQGLAVLAESLLLVRGTFPALAISAATACAAGTARIVTSPTPGFQDGFTMLLALALGLCACAAYAMAREPEERRSAPRRPSTLTAKLHLGGAALEGALTDVSLGGARFVPFHGEAPHAPGLGLLRLVIAAGAPEALFRVRVRSARPEGGGLAYGLMIESAHHAEFADAVTLAYGAADPYLDATDASRWVRPFPAFAWRMALRGAELAVLQVLSAVRATPPAEDADGDAQAAPRKRAG